MIQLAANSTAYKAIFGLIILLVSNSLKAQPFFKTHTAINPYQYEVIKEKAFEHAAVSSAHPLASMVGAAMMQDGGNAFDAAIATQFSLAVVFPGAGNIGGGGFMLARKANGELIGLDYREAAPKNANRDMYLDDKGEAIVAKSRDGALASGIPGSVAGMISTLPYAKKTLAELIEPAIELAEFGFVITEKEARGLNNERNNFLKNSSAPCAFTSREWKAGDTLFQPDLAATLKRIQEKGLAGFYEGPTADMIVAEMKHSGGIITKKDLKNLSLIHI